MSITANADARSGRPVRIGAVNYLNTKPLVRGLAESLPAAEVEFEVPSRLADRLASGELDVALAPAIEVARHPEWSITSTACIGCRGPVLSVKLLFRRPPAEVRTLALDEGSRTSVVLAQILLAEIVGVRPAVVPLPLDAPLDSVEADALLVIGDRAIKQDVTPFVEAWDLGDRWLRWTELPFVFAVWAARPGFDAAEIEAALEAARDRGVRDLELIVAEQATAMRLPAELVRTYLRDNLNFYLAAGERRGLEAYLRKAEALGLISPRAGAVPGPRGGPAADARVDRAEQCSCGE
ncbi:MAG: menaquinone biosynthesis protein [Pirellulales bacterium]|nr:menaquinone biosynthesis protein [Pirellulales bacterium]